MMERFVPYEKLSKKARRKLDSTKRRGWGGLDPVTRIADRERKYSRKMKHPEKFF